MEQLKVHKANRDGRSSQNVQIPLLLISSRFQIDIERTAQVSYLQLINGSVFSDLVPSDSILLSFHTTSVFCILY